MKLEQFSLVFPEQYLRAALMISLLSVWVLVGLFYYLNRYTRREYFTIWTAAWLFYALWLTLSLQAQSAPPESLIFMLRQCCASVSAVFLLWGSLRFLGLAVRQTLLGLFMLFLVVWTLISPEVLRGELQVELPVFILLGSSSGFAAVCFFRLRKQKAFVGAGMLSLGFLLWGIYLAIYPFSQQYKELHSAGFFVAAVLQLFIAVSMIVLVLEEVRHHAEQVRAEIAAVRLEKDALQVRVLTSEEECRSLYDRVRLTEGTQKAYDELRRTQQAVVQQERLRALGQMASGVAHDINNALSPITAYSELLLCTLPDLEDGPRQQLRNISKSAGDITQIVAHMREFYRRDMDTDMLAKVNVGKLIEEVIELTRPRWRDLPQRQGISIQIKQDVEAALPPLLSDARELREALINLVFNSVDALPQGGIITLAARCVSRPGEEAGRQNIQIEVRDNGVGMEEKTRQHCLEPFFSTKLQRGGTGLGLAMVYGMVQRHEGNIEIDSAPGSGTCMRLIFPVRQQAVSTSRPQTAPEEPARSLRILCIDDEPMMLELLHDCLQVFHHKVTIAPGGRQGLEAFRLSAYSKKPFEIVITDLGMPEMDGHQVVRAIKAESPETPIVMLTGWGTIMKADGETVPEVDAVVGKPPRLQDLNNILLRLTAAGARRSGVGVA